MRRKRVCLAVDLGAGSGRVVAGIYNGARLRLNELIRFPNDAVKETDGWHWNIERLFAHVKQGIALAAKKYGDAVVSIGVDTWGVDYGLLDAEWEIVVRAVSIPRQPHAGNGGRSIPTNAAKGNLSADGHPVHVFQHTFSIAGRGEFAGAA